MPFKRHGTTPLAVSMSRMFLACAVDAVMGHPENFRQKFTQPDVSTIVHNGRIKVQTVQAQHKGEDFDLVTWEVTVTMKEVKREALPPSLIEAGKQEWQELQVQAVEQLEHA